MKNLHRQRVRHCSDNNLYHKKTHNIASSDDVYLKLLIM